MTTGSDSDRRRLAVYCLKDAYLPQQLLNKLAIIVNYVEVSRLKNIYYCFWIYTFFPSFLDGSCHWCAH